MTNSEHSVLAAIAELEAEENPDDITELVRWQLTQGVERGEGPTSCSHAVVLFDTRWPGEHQDLICYVCSNCWFGTVLTVEPGAVPTVVEIRASLAESERRFESQAG